MKDKTTQDLQAELDAILAWFESDAIDIDKAMQQYEHGLKLAHELQKRLKETTNTITKLSQSFDEA